MANGSHDDATCAVIDVVHHPVLSHTEPETADTQPRRGRRAGIRRETIDSFLYLRLGDGPQSLELPPGRPLPHDSEHVTPLLLVTVAE
jgi:hypothetical protein